MNKNKNFILSVSLVIVGLYFLYELKQRRDENKNKSEQLAISKSAYDNLAVMVWTKNLGDTLTSVNKAYEREVFMKVFPDKWERKNYIGLPCDSIFGPGGNKVFKENTQEVIRQRKTLQFLEYVIQQKTRYVKEPINCDTLLMDRKTKEIHGDSCIIPFYYIDTLWCKVTKFPIFEDSIIIGTGGIAEYINLH